MINIGICRDFIAVNATINVARATLCLRIVDVKQIVTSGYKAETLLPPFVATVNFGNNLPAQEQVK